MNLDLLIDAASWITLSLGSVFFVVGAIGIVRMPDVFTRMHAASVTETLGAGLMFVGMILQAGFTIVTLKLLMLMALLYITGPVVTHALAQAALAAGLEPVLDDHRAANDTDK